MRGTEKLVLLLALLVPLALVLVGGPAVMRWIAQPPASRSPEVAGAVATPVAQSQATPRATRAPRVIQTTVARETPRPSDLQPVP